MEYPGTLSFGKGRANTSTFFACRRGRDQISHGLPSVHWEVPLQRWSWRGRLNCPRGSFWFIFREPGAPLEPLIDQNEAKRVCPHGLSICACFSLP